MRYVLGWLLVVLLSAMVYDSARAGYVGNPRERCARRIASLTNPRLMSHNTAVRKARVLCLDLQDSDRYLFKALTQ